jgi:hypothetical protein
MTHQSLVPRSREYTPTADALIGGLTLVIGRLLVMVCLVQVGPHLRWCARVSASQAGHPKTGVRFPAVVAGRSALGLKTAGSARERGAAGSQDANRTAGTMGT